MEKSLANGFRPLTYLVTGVGLLFVLFPTLRDSQWQGNKDLHTIMEVIATVLALLVGVLEQPRHLCPCEETI